MAIWDWLDPWWAWWAAFTDLFEWPAISATLSSIAILFTIWLADRGRRDQRRREAGYLRGVAVTFEAIYQTLDTPQEEVTDSDLKVEWIALHRSWERLGVTEMMKEIDVKLLTSHFAIAAVQNGRAAIRVLATDARQAEEQGKIAKVSSYRQRAENLNSAIKELKASADAISPDIVWTIFGFGGGKASYTKSPT